MLKAKGPPSAPPTLAAAAVLGQTGLWGRLMGGPDNTKAPLEETENTDGEDEVICDMYMVSNGAYIYTF